MTEISSAPAVAEAPGSLTDAVTAAGAREVLVAVGARRDSVLARWRKRLSWPLGIYTTPVAILIIWEVLAEAGVLGGEQRARAPEPGGDLVQYQEQAMPVAQLPQLTDDPGSVEVHAPGPLDHRLDDHSGQLMGMALDQSLQLGAVGLDQVA